MEKLNWIRLLASTAMLSLLLFQTPLQGAWQAPQVISNPDIPQVSDNGQPVLKVNAPGNAIAIWTDAFSNTFQTSAIGTAFYQQGAGWLPPVQISDLQSNCIGNPLFISQGDPDVAINSTNYAVAAWEAQDNSCSELNGTYVVLATTRNAQGIWDSPELISDLSFNAYLVNVSLNENGTALAAWYNDDGVSNFIAASFLPFGGSWSPQNNFPSFIIVPGLTKPYPFINSSGNAVITWQGRTTPTNFAIQAVNYISGTWGSVVNLDASPIADISFDPRCALAPNGNAVAIWQKNNFVNASFFNGVTWGPFVTLGIAAPFNPTFNNDGPEVVVDPNGNFTATWTSDDNAIMSASTTNGTWSTPVVISTPPDLYSFEPYNSQETLAVNTKGDVIAIYHGISSGLGQPSFTPIFSAFKPFGLPWLPQETIDEPSDGFVDNSLNIGLSTCGFAAAIWANEENTLVYGAVNGGFILPTDPSIVRCCQKTATGRRCINVLTWIPDDCVLFYTIFCNGVPIATVFNTGDSLRFVDTLASCRDCVYTISATSILGFEGDQVSFTVL